MVSRSLHVGAILRGKGAPHCKVLVLSTVSCAKMAEPVEVPFGGPKEAWGSYWHHLPNTIERSICGSYAVFLSNYFDHLLNFGTPFLSLEYVTLSDSNLIHRLTVLLAN